MTTKQLIYYILGSYDYISCFENLFFDSARLAIEYYQEKYKKKEPCIRLDKFNSLVISHDETEEIISKKYLYYKSSPHKVKKIIEEPRSYQKKIIDFDFSNYNHYGLDCFKQFCRNKYSKNNYSLGYYELKVGEIKKELKEDGDDLELIYSAPVLVRFVKADYKKIYEQKEEGKPYIPEREKVEELEKSDWFPVYRIEGGQFCKQQFGLTENFEQYYRAKPYVIRWGVTAVANRMEVITEL